MRSRPLTTPAEVLLVVTAAPQDQWRLLDVQAHDTRLTQLAHRRRTLPEHAEIERTNGQLRLVAGQLVAARTVASDIARELTKAEADVEQVRQRAARDRARLDVGQGSAKDLQAIQHELESLAQRQSVLEDAELEVMERLEAAQARVGEVETDQERLTAELAEVIARRDRLIGEVDDEVNVEQQARANSAAGLPADLLALYEKVRESAGGVGAARLYQRRCEGCRLELNTTDLNKIRVAPPDTVVRCEECRRILVRTPDSGL
jgi:predicted  nucleic acid-binding Zn-ribbon protein